MQPRENFFQYSIDNIGQRLYSYELDKINKLFVRYVPNVILILSSDRVEQNERDRIKRRCNYEGQTFSNIPESVYKKIGIGTYGYTAQDTGRDLLYQYTNYNESISFQSIPIYYLDVNTRVTVQDSKSNIYGDYIIKSINIPIAPTGTMSISATRALERI